MVGIGSNRALRWYQYQRDSVSLSLLSTDSPTVFFSIVTRPSTSLRGRPFRPFALEMQFQGSDSIILITTKDRWRAFNEERHPEEKLSHYVKSSNPSTLICDDDYPLNTSIQCKSDTARVNSNIMAFR